MKNAMQELQIQNRDARIITQSEELHRLRVSNSEHTANAQAYEKVLGPKTYQEVADELANLRAVNAQLLEALKEILSDVVSTGEMCTQSLVRTDKLNTARAAIAAAEGKP